MMLWVAPETPPDRADALQGARVPLSKPPFWIMGLLVLQPDVAEATAVDVVDGSELEGCGGAGTSSTTELFQVSLWLAIQEMAIESTHMKPRAFFSATLGLTRRSCPGHVHTVGDYHGLSTTSVVCGILESEHQNGCTFLGYKVDRIIMRCRDSELAVGN